MQDFAVWLVMSSDVKAIYTLFLLGIMLLPIIGLAIWYHWGIGRTPGGRQLMGDQNSDRNRPVLHSPNSNAVGQFLKAGALHSAVMSGRYGSDAKRKQIIVYKVCALWLAAFAFFALLPFMVAWLAGF